MSTKSLVASLMAAGAVLSLPMTAGAEDSAFRKDLIQRSVRSGVGQGSLPLLAREAGPGRERAASLLRTKLCGSGCNAVAVNGDQTRLKGEGWELTVLGDGTAGKYRHFDQMAKMQEQGRPTEERLRLDALERLGRAFVADTLRDVVTLGVGEALVPFKSVYELRGGQSTSGGDITEEVVGNTIVFTRTVRGVAVVGAGSKVAVTFANDGTPVSFDYDWPRYRVTTVKQTVVPAATVLQRVQTVASLRGGGAGVSSGKGAFAAQSPDAMRSVPAPLLPDMMLEKLECGYFDSGLRKRDARAFIQSGCFAHLAQQRVSPSGEGALSAAYAGAIPAGEQVMADGKWGELAMLGFAEALPSTATIPGDPTGVK